MNRFKKEVRKQGFKLENDYPWLPYDEGSMTVDSVVADAENCTLTIYYTSLKMVIGFDKCMQSFVKDFD